MTTNEILDHSTRVFGPERVYGEPHVVGDITVIPAAIVRGGGGAGHGARPGGETGDGGGFGVAARPAGALVIDGDTVRWKVPFDLNKAILGGQLVGVAFFLFSWLTERSKARAAIKIARLELH